MLVTHYFGGKRDLFLAVVELPLIPAPCSRRSTGDHDSAGTRLATLVLSILDDDVRRRPLLGLVPRRRTRSRRARARDF